MSLQSPAPIASAPLRLDERPDLIAKDGELIVDIAACGVCRTDLQLCEGDLAARTLPIVPGHQLVGRVAAIGPNVTTHAVGDRVGVAWLAGACGVCAHCRAGRENLCERAQFTGWDRDGGYATAARVRADFAYPLPATFSDEAAAPLLCGGLIGYRSLRLSGVQPGGRLGLYGFGASALLTIQVARHRGMEVYVCTRSEAEQRRALELGAVWAGGYDRPPPVPLDGAITFAPVGSVVLAALRAVDRGGTVAINAIHLDHIPEFPYQNLWWERRLQSVANFTRNDATEFLSLAAEIPIQTHYDLFPLESANEALLRLLRGEINGAAVLKIDQG